MNNRNYYKDRYNPSKVWEVTKLKGGYYLKQYIKGKQMGRGVKTSKSYLNQVGILEFDKIDNIAKHGGGLV